jgi:hypothetical protein
LLDYAALDVLLELLARLIPLTQGTAVGRARRKEYLQQVFLTSPGIFSHGNDIVQLLERVPSDDWEETASELIDILARDIA